MPDPIKHALFLAADSMEDAVSNLETVDIGRLTGEDYDTIRLVIMRLRIAGKKAAELSLEDDANPVG